MMINTLFIRSVSIRLRYCCGHRLWFIQLDHHRHQFQFKDQTTCVPQVLYYKAVGRLRVGTCVGVEHCWKPDITSNNNWGKKRKEKDKIFVRGYFDRQKFGSG